MSDQRTGPRFGLTTLVFVVFLTMKLTGYTDMSWWWVTAPLWIPLAAGLLVMAVVGVVMWAGGAFR